MPSSHLILCRPLLRLLPIPPSIRVFSNESALHMRWPKYWSFSFSIIPSKEIPGLISFRMDWLDLLAVQATLKSILQHHSSKASILQCSAFFTVQFSHPYMTTGKTIALSRRTFVGKVMSLLFSMLSAVATAAAKSLQLCQTLCDPMDSSMSGFPVHHQLPEIPQTHSTESVVPSNHHIICCPLLLLPSVFPSIGIFSNELVLYLRRPKYWSFSFSISLSNEYSGLISLRIDWSDLLVFQGTLKRLLQHHNSKASFLWHSAFFMVQLSHPYVTTIKSIALTSWTLLAK